MVTMQKGTSGWAPGSTLQEPEDSMLQEEACLSSELAAETKAGRREAVDREDHWGRTRATYGWTRSMG